MTRRMWLRPSQLAIWLPVLAYALLVSRQFFHFADAAIYISSDDGVANISYALATEGRYGFLSSPILAGMPRDHGLFSYGPFYFYAGAALIWLFGYSLTVLRFIHLAVMLGVAGAARAWFGDRAGGAAGAVTAIGVLMAFERAHWPMVRPDSIVTLFGVALVVAAGLAMRTGRARYWFAAGVFGACGAFTHLVAWSLVPAVVVILVAGYVAAARDDEGRWAWSGLPWGPLVATASGGLLGAASFYASFGFRFKEQWLFLTDYQRVTGSMGGGPSPGFVELLGRHFEQAYWYLPYPLAYLVWATAIVAVVVLAVSAFLDRGPRRRQVMALVAPPVVVWFVYFLSLGTYNNFHSGYAILNQVMWVWTIGALVAAALVAADTWPEWQLTARAGAWLAAFTLAVGMLTFLAARTDYRALAAAAHVPIDEYLSRVLEAMPVRARAWGSVEFGIENPRRIQLIQFWDAIKMVESVAPNRRPPLAPDYLVLGPVESGSNTSEVLSAVDRDHVASGREIATAPRRLQDMFPDARYRLVSMVAGPPYGVTRVYAWVPGAPALPRPIVNVYDPQLRQWNSGVGEAMPLSIGPAPAVTVATSAGASATSRTAVQSVQAELPEGLYLLQVTIADAAPDGEPLVIVASPSTTIAEDIRDPSRGIDVAPWFAGDRVVDVIYQHPGGPVYVSQFGTGAPAIAGVGARPILALANYAGLRRAPEEVSLPAGVWTAAFPALTVTPAGPGQVAVHGDVTQFGYQAYGPRIEVRKGQRLRLRVPVTVQAGRACFGVLDGTEERWLIAPDHLLPEYEFVINDSRTVKPVLANCNGTPQDIAPTRATIGDGTYALWDDREELYVDQLMREFRNATPR